MGLMPSRFSCGSAIGTQISPRAWRIIMLTSSGVAFSAAMSRSPSFSRPSSSVTMISPPAAIVWIAVSMESKGVAADMGGAVKLCRRPPLSNPGWLSP